MADTPAQASFSQHASILAILAGAVPEGERRALMHRLVDGELAGQDSPGAAAVSPASFYFRFYLARALQSSGEGELYLSLLGPWKRMLALGLSTWAEQPEPTRSDCHAWSAHPDYDFLNLVAGIQPLTPGFRTVRIAPCLGQGRDALDRLDAVMAHPDGRIRVHYERLGPVLEAEITLPPGVQGRFEWRGRSLPLHEGLQQLRVEPNVPR